MVKFKTTSLDTRELRLSLALTLFDGFSRTSRLVGHTTVRFADKPLVRPFLPFQKAPEAIFLFFEPLPPGAYTVEIRSEEDDPPYYLPADVSVVLPMPNPLWPAFPDVSLADQNKPLDDPTQPAAYRAQRAAVTLQPSTAYPFPVGATLVRGRVIADAMPLAAAMVRRGGDDMAYTTGEDGEFVLFFPGINGMAETVTLRASHPLHVDVDHTVQIRRGMTVATIISMVP
jgi:hypothetical protein